MTPYVHNTGCICCAGTPQHTALCFKDKHSSLVTPLHVVLTRDVGMLHVVSERGCCMWCQSEWGCCMWNKSADAACSVRVGMLQLVSECCQMLHVVCRVGMLQMVSECCQMLHVLSEWGCCSWSQSAARCCMWCQRSSDPFELKG